MTFLRVLLIAALFAAPASAQTLVKLQVATTPNDSGAEVYYAQDMGFFKKAGLDVDITTLNNGGLISAGIAAGTFDVAQAAISSIASAHERGVNFVIIAPAALWVSDRATSALVVAKNSPLTTAKDFDGKTIAVNGLRNVTQVGPEAWIEQGGGDLASVKFLELPFSDMPGAVAAGRIDAAQISEPALDAAVKAGGDESDRGALRCHREAILTGGLVYHLGLGASAPGRGTKIRCGHARYCALGEREPRRRRGRFSRNIRSCRCRPRWRACCIRSA